MRAKQDGRFDEWRERQRNRREAARIHKPCPHCGDPMLHGRRVQCGKPECERTQHRLRNREYKRRLNAERLRAKAFDCAHCAKHCIPGENVSAHATKFCCRRCKKAWHAIRANRRGPTCRISARPAPCTWIEGHCPECGERFVRRGNLPDCVGYCSRRCQKRVARRRRRALIAGPGRKTLGFWTVAERDGWTCGLCGGAVDKELIAPAPMAPTMDHVIPLAVGGTHTEDNVQLAHFICNSRKGDGTAIPIGAQAALV